MLLQKSYSFSPLFLLQIITNILKSYILALETDDDLKNQKAYLMAVLVIKVLQPKDTLRRPARSAGRV